tara:strand:+ start:1238 stop:2974 length:1737 start_codon:yes stop_codon:yes gene_type:complete
MFIKIKMLMRIAFIVMCLWTVIVAILTVNLVYSSKINATNRAVEDAKSAISNFMETSSWLINAQTLKAPYLIDNMSKQNSSTVLNELLEKPISKGASLLIPIKHGNPEIFLIVTNNDGKYQFENNRLESWQRNLLEKSIESKEDVLLFEEINKNKFVRIVEPIVKSDKCDLCEVFDIKNYNNIAGGIFVSVELTEYFSKSYSHVWNMVRNIAVIWMLGVAAIVYGYKKTSKAVSNKLRDYEESIYNLVDIIEKRDSYTAGHTQRVAKYAMLIANKIGVSDDDKSLLYRASMLHDIGKISTPDSVLLKPGKLSDLEYKIIKEHVTTSYEILTKVTIYKDIAEIVRHHHEYYDGSGYPQGLKGKDIPFLSQILTVADAFDAMTTDRIYKGRKTVIEAVEEISQLSGRQFNPILVQPAIHALSEVNTERKVSQLPESDLQQERFSYFYKDNVTHAYNQRYLELLLSKRNQELKKYRYTLLIRLHHFSQYNSENSWNKGDEKLSKIVNVLQTLEENNLVFRLFGDDFIILLENKVEPLQMDNLLSNELKTTCLYYSTRYIDLNGSPLVNFDELEKVMHSFEE